MLSDRFYHGFLNLPLDILPVIKVVILDHIAFALYLNENYEVLIYFFFSDGKWLCIPDTKAIFKFDILGYRGL